LIWIRDKYSGSATLHRFFAKQEKEPSWGAGPKIELGPALQQADALTTEPRRNFFPGRYLSLDPHLGPFPDTV
jgi:hypothetical protein